MFDVEDIRDWVGLAVVDSDGAKIGTMESVYFDTATDAATFATVKTGLPGASRLQFVPLAGAKVAPKHVKVLTDKKTARDSPVMDLDGQLSSTSEPMIYEHYNLPYSTGAGGERRLGRR